MSDTLEFLQRILKKKGLEVVCYFNPDRSDSVCPTIRTIILIGTKEPHFWYIFKKSKQYREKKKDPLDRWSKKILQKIALNFDAKPFFPFEAPFQPFIAWAKECNTMSSSPVGLLVHIKKVYLFLFGEHLVYMNILNHQMTYKMSVPHARSRALPSAQ